jgi:hypothetical protein
MIKGGNRAEIEHDPKHQTVNTYHEAKSFWACAVGNKENKWEGTAHGGLNRTKN